MTSKERKIIIVRKQVTKGNYKYRYHIAETLSTVINRHGNKVFIGNDTEKPAAQIPV
jgi:hypothetical protein